MTLKIKASTLHSFLVKTTANGLVTDCKLVFGENALEMKHKDPPGVIYIGGFLDKSAFVEYEPMTLEMKSTETVLKILAMFKDNVINIVRNDNMAKIQDETSSFDLALAEKVACHKEGPIPALDYDNTLLCKKSMADQIVKSSSVVKSDSIVVANENKVLSFSIGKESDKAQVTCATPVDEKKTTTFDLGYFQKLTSNMDIIFDLSIGDNVPSKFHEKTDKYECTYFITPVRE